MTPRGIAALRIVACAGAGCAVVALATDLFHESRAVRRGPERPPPLAGVREALSEASWLAAVLPELPPGPFIGEAFDLRVIADLQARSGDLDGTRRTLAA